MARCIIHIGWHKTGSTALQMAAHRSSKALFANGLHYPAFNHNHGSAVFSALREGQDIYFPEVFVAPQPLRAGLCAKVAGQAFLDEIIDTAPDVDLLLSGEDLCLLEYAEIQALKSQLENSFDEIEIVAYVRNHDGYLDSTVQQLVRMGFSLPELFASLRGEVSVKSNVRVMTLLPAYYARISRWIAVFGKEAVHVHSYDRIMGDGQDIVAHFTRTHLRNQAQRDLIVAGGQAENTRFSALAIQTLSALHQETPLFVGGVPNPAFRVNLQRFFAHMTGPPLRIAPLFKDELSAAAEADSAGLRDVLSADDIDAMRAAGSNDPLSEEQPVDAELLCAMSKMGSAALNNAAREKFFGSLLIGEKDPQYKLAQGNLHVVLFWLTDPDLLASCAVHLLSRRQTSLAVSFLDKAQTLGCDPARLADLRARAKAQTGPPQGDKTA